MRSAGFRAASVYYPAAAARRSEPVNRYAP